MQNEHCPKCGKARYSEAGVLKNWYDCGTWDIGATGQVRQTLQCRVLELERAINSVLDQKADNACWRDIYVMLSECVGRKEEIAAMLALLPMDRMLGNCVRYLCSLKDGKEYQTDYTTSKIMQLEAEVKKLREGRKIPKGKAGPTPRKCLWEEFQETGGRYLEGYKSGRGAGVVDGYYKDWLERKIMELEKQIESLTEGV